MPGTKFIETYEERREGAEAGERKAALCSSAVLLDCTARLPEEERNCVWLHKQWHHWLASLSLDDQHSKEELT